MPKEPVTIPLEVLPLPTAPVALTLPDDLPPSTLAPIKEGFLSMFERAEEWRVKALSIKVTDISQTEEIKLARKVRLELKHIRVEGEKTRKRLKEDSLRAGKAIDGANALLVAAIAPLEAHLDAQENFVVRLQEAARRELLESRTAELAPYLDGTPAAPLENMTDAQFATYLADMKLLHETKLAAAEKAAQEAAAKAEAERVAREQRETEERALRAAEAARAEALAAENKRLADEARARAAELAAEREKARKEKEAAEAKARAASEAAAAAAKAERDRSPPAPGRSDRCDPEVHPPGIPAPALATVQLSRGELHQGAMPHPP